MNYFKNNILGFAIIVVTIVLVVGTLFAILDNIRQYKERTEATANANVPLDITPPLLGLPDYGPTLETEGWHVAPKGYLDFCKLNPTEC